MPDSAPSSKQLVWEWPQSISEFSQDFKPDHGKRRPTSIHQLEDKVEYGAGARGIALLVNDMYHLRREEVGWRAVRNGHYDGYLYLKEHRVYRRILRRYGELCQMTFSAFLPIEPDGTPFLVPPAPEVARSPFILVDLINASKHKAQEEQAQQPNGRELDRTPVLPMELFLAPHPVAHSVKEAKKMELPDWPKQYPYEKGALQGHGLLEPDSPLVELGYKVTKYLYGAAGLTDANHDAPCGNWIGYIAHSENMREVVLVFRGTGFLCEWTQNADFRAIPVHRLLPQACFRRPDQVLAHNGFYEIYYHELKNKQALNLQVIEGLKETCKSLPWRPEGLTITGHSLGGALATVAAFDLVHAAAVDPKLNRLVKGGLRHAIQGITWAQPRVGNEAYQEEFECRVGRGKWLRLVCEGDIVPRVPFATVSWLAEILDMSYNQRLQQSGKGRCNASHAQFVQQACQMANQVHPRLSVKADDVMEHMRTARQTKYCHVGWELRFDPANKRHFPYLNVRRFDDSKAVDAPLFRGLVWVGRQVWHLVQNPALSAISGQVINEEPIYFERLGQRHNLELHLHLVDPSMDKVRMNKGGDLLVVDKLSEREQRRLGYAKRARWWMPYEHNGMRLVQKKESGKCRWVYVPAQDGDASEHGMCSTDTAKSERSTTTSSSSSKRSSHNKGALVIQMA